MRIVERSGGSPHPATIGETALSDIAHRARVGTIHFERGYTNVSRPMMSAKRQAYYADSIEKRNYEGTHPSLGALGGSVVHPQCVTLTEESQAVTESNIG